MIGGDDMEMDMQEPGEMCHRHANSHIPAKINSGYIGVVGMHAICIITTTKDGVGSA